MHRQQADRGDAQAQQVGAEVWEPDLVVWDYAMNEENPLLFRGASRAVSTRPTERSSSACACPVAERSRPP